MKIAKLVALGLTAGVVLTCAIGCRIGSCAAPKAVVASTNQVVARSVPTKTVKNDPDHVHILLTDGSTVSFVHTNSP